LLGIHRGEETLSHVETPDHAATRLTHVPLLAGDTLVVHTKWESLTRLSRNRDYVVVTSEYPREEVRPQKVSWALVFFVLAIAMILLTDIRLSLCLLTGAAGMIVSRVLSIDEAYEAVSWNTVFLLASLIPLGVAVQTTGTAAWIAQQVLMLLGGLADLGLASGCGDYGDCFHIGDVQCWRHRVARAFGRVHRGCSGGQPSYFCADCCHIDLKLFFDPHPSGECSDYGTRRV
jgi:hypothetical protein